MTSVERWQYQVKAEPLEPIVADFGWFVQASEPVREQPETVLPTEPALGNVEILPILWAGETSILLQVNELIQYQTQALGRPPVIPAFDWYRQEEDVIYPLHQTNTGTFVSGREEEIIEVDLDWFIEEPDPVLPLPQTQLGWYVKGYDDTEIRPGYGWHTLPADVIRSPDSLVPEGYVLGAEPTTSSFDWFRQQEDVFSALHQVHPGFFAFVDFGVPALLDIDWIVPQPDVIRPVDRLVPEQSVLGAVPIIPVFDWFIVPPDIIRPLHPVRLGLWVSGREEEVIEVDLDWFVEEPDPVLPLHQTRQGFFVLGRPPIIPAFDWWQQETDVIRPPKRLVPEAFALVEFRVPTPLDFDWWVQEPDVFHPAHLVRPGLFVTGTLPLIPSFGWWAQEPDVFKAPPHPEGFIARLDPVIPPEVLLQWFQIQENPILPFVWLLGEETRPLLVLVTPPGEVVFVIRDCIALSALEQNSVLPLPSTFIRAEDIITPSTFVEDEDAVTPSTWIQEGKSTLWDDLSS